MAVSPSNYLTISIRDAISSSDSFGPYTSYRIITNTNIPGFIYGEILVERRYSDFVWLSSELSRVAPGVIIPALPEKQYIGSMVAGFVETRKKALERFLLRIAAHHDLNRSVPFIAFLQADEVGLKVAKDAAKKEQTKKLSTTAIAWFEGAVNSLSAGKIELEKTEADIQIEEITQYVSSVEKNMQRLTKQSEALVKSSRDNSRALKELSEGIVWLGQAENESQALADALAKVGSTIDSLSLVSGVHAESEYTDLEEPMSEYVRLLACVRLALHQRQEKRTGYITALTELEAKQAAYNKVANVPGKADQAALKYQLVEKAQLAAEELKEDYDRVSQRVIIEFEIFKKQKVVDMRDVMLNFACLQTNYARAMDKAWTEMIPLLEAVTSAAPGAVVRLGDAGGIGNISKPSPIYGTGAGLIDRTGPVSPTTLSFDTIYNNNKEASPRAEDTENVGVLSGALQSSLSSSSRTLVGGGATANAAVVAAAPPSHSTYKNGGGAESRTNNNSYAPRTSPAAAATAAVHGGSSASAVATDDVGDDGKESTGNGVIGRGSETADAVTVTAGNAANGSYNTSNIVDVNAAVGEDGGVDDDDDDDVSKNDSLSNSVSV